MAKSPSKSYPAPDVVLSVGGSLLNDGAPNEAMARIIARVGRIARQIAVYVQWDDGNVEFVDTGHD